MTTTLFSFTKAILYQTDDVLAERVPGYDAFAAFMASVQKTISAFFSEVHEPEVLAVVVTLKPGNRVRVWFVSTSRAGDDAVLTGLREAIESASAPAVYSGPVAFAIVVGIGGATLEPENRYLFEPPLPKEWREAAARSIEPAVLPDGVLDQAWPDADGEVSMMTDTPLSDLISRVITNPSSDDAWDAFCLALLDAPLGVSFPDAPIGANRVALEEMRLAITNLPDGRRLLLACADPPMFAKKFHDQFNAEVLGANLLATSLAFPCDGIVVNSAAQPHGLPIDRAEIVALLQHIQSGGDVAEPVESSASNDEDKLCPCGSGKQFPICHGVEESNEGA